jgi:hypothetical protein
LKTCLQHRLTGDRLTISHHERKNTLQAQTSLPSQRKALADKALAAHRAISELTDDSENTIYAENGVVVRIAPSLTATAQLCKSIKNRATTSLGFSITASNVGEAIYLLLDTADAIKTGVFDSITSKLSEPAEAEVGYMSGYPQIFGWFNDGEALSEPFNTVNNWL